MLKRERSRNFIDEEKVLLVHIVKRYIPIVENKKTDATTSREKIKAWDFIADEFNSSARTGERTGAQLKALFDNLKKQAKKHKADDKTEIYNTEGSICSQSTLSALDEEVLDLIGLQGQPINNELDSNVDYDCVWSEKSVDMDNKANVEIIAPEESFVESGSEEPQLYSGKTPWSSKRRTEVNYQKHREEWHKKRMEILKIIEEREKVDLEKAKLELEIKKIELEKIKRLNTL